MSAEAIELDIAFWPRQMQALRSPATEILFGGASEGGKSHLMRHALIIWCMAIPGLQCTLIRKKYDDIIKNHVKGPAGFNSILKPLIEVGRVSVTQKDVKFSNGSVIDFVHCQDERQFDSAQGVEKHVLAVDEATQISERLIRIFRGWVRMSQEMAERLPEEWRGMFPRILYTANPIGQSVGFFRRQFVKARPAFAIEEVEGFKRQYIPSKATDNKSVDLVAHAGRLAGIGDAALAKALDEGDWDAPVGDFFREWDESRHVIPHSMSSLWTPPEHWFRFRTFDWGTAEPFAAYWVAVSDGEQFSDHEGRVRWFPRGALVFYREWYGCNPDKPAEGLRMRNEDIATGILKRSTSPGEQGLVTLTDSLPFQDRGGVTIAQTFAENGVLLVQGDTSRVTGWSQLRSRLIGKEIDSNDYKRDPMIYFTESCVWAREYIPTIPRNDKKPEDAVEDGETTHSPDAIRLACMAHKIIADAPSRPVNTADLQNEITMERAIEQIRQERHGEVRY